MSDVVRIEIGSSIFEGEMIVQEAQAAGIRVELLRNEHPETGGFIALGRCAVLVAGEHESDLRALLETFGY